MISCAHCQAQVEDDSFFCDQCGKEILICSQCGKTGIGKRCIDDGKPLMPAQMKALGMSSLPASVPVGIVAQQPVGASAPSVVPSAVNQVTQGQSAVPSGVSALTLVNNTLNLRITIQDGDLIGRSQGQHTAIFGQHGQVSGQHARFTHDRQQNVWYVTDLNSSNYTKLGSSSDWSTTPRLPPHSPMPLANGQRLLIAHLEFIIQITGVSTPSGPATMPAGTIRIV